MITILLRLLAIIGLFLLSRLQVFAQYHLPENKIWIFDARNGIDFNGAVPQAVTSDMCYSCPVGNGEIYPPGASVCDTSGQLLFYTDGSIIWNRNGQKMNHANPSLGANNFAGQVTVGVDGALIVGMPDSSDKYYVFSLTDIGRTYPNPGTLFYSVVDMQLDNGLGDVIPGRRWILLDTGLAQIMTAVPGDNCNAWLIVHAKTTNMFKAYEITWKGINPHPVISYIGNPTGAPFYTNSFNYSNGWDNGQLTISPDRTKLAATYGQYAELYDFDPVTGIVSNGWVIDTSYTGNPNDLKGICFSSDNSKLYTVHWQFPFYTFSPDCAIYQFDLSLGTPAMIQSSVNVVAGVSYTPWPAIATISELRLAPDGKIYFANLDGMQLQRFGTIEFPNVYGPACIANQNPISASPQYRGVGWGMGNEFVKAIANPGPDTVILVTLDTCIGQSLRLHVPYSADFIGYLWDDGTTDSVRTITMPGTYWVQGIDRCSNRTIQPFNVKQSPQFSLGNDTTICNVPFLLETDVPGAQYHWQDGSTKSVFQVNASGRYWVAVTQNDCTDTQSIHVTAIDVHPDLGTHDPLCNGETLLLDPKVTEPGAVYTWQDGSHNATYSVRDSGIYWVSVQKDICFGSDTTEVKVIGCNCAPFIPNAFSPNHDGANDFFFPQFIDCDRVINYSLSIYNRFGQRVYFGATPTPGWDGMFNGQPVDAGTYFFYLQYTTPRLETFKLKGDITIIR